MSVGEAQEVGSSLLLISELAYLLIQLSCVYLTLSYSIYHILYAPKGCAMLIIL